MSPSKKDILIEKFNKFIDNKDIKIIGKKRFLFEIESLMSDDDDYYCYDFYKTTIEIIGSLYSSSFNIKTIPLIKLLNAVRYYNKILEIYKKEDKIDDLSMCDINGLDETIDNILNELHFSNDITYNTVEKVINYLLNPNLDEEIKETFFLILILSGCDYRNYAERFLVDIKETGLLRLIKLINKKSDNDRVKKFILIDSYIDIYENYFDGYNEGYSNTINFMSFESYIKAVNFDKIKEVD